MEKIVIVLAMHGGPPNDFPKREMAEFFGLRAQLQKTDGVGTESLKQRHAELDSKIRKWPRTVSNDPFQVGSQQLAGHLNRLTGYEVVVGYDEFCAPSLDDALDQAIAQSPEKVIVVTPMMTPGGKHSEVDIPEAIQRAKGRHPGIPIHYVWPFNLSEVATFLSTQVNRFI